jgi:hypothetical protein
MAPSMATAKSTNDLQQNSPSHIKLVMLLDKFQSISIYLPFLYSGHKHGSKCHGYIQLCLMIKNDDEKSRKIRVTFKTCYRHCGREPTRQHQHCCGQSSVSENDPMAMLGVYR